MACPYFMPTERCADLWPHAARMPLGGCWTGHCTAPGHEGIVPSEEELKSGCNLGYARCGKLPGERHADAVRFSCREREGSLTVQYVLEIGHRPAESGVLAFDAATRRCLSVHADARVQRMAECFLKAKRESKSAAAGC